MAYKKRYNAILVGAFVVIIHGHKIPKADNGLFAKSRGFQKHISRDSAEFGVVRSLNKKYWDVSQCVQPRGQGRLIAKLHIEQIETELRGTDHERESGEAGAFHSNLHHLRGGVIHGVENQGANARIPLGLSQRGIGAEVVTPHAKTTGIYVVTRGH